MQTSAKKIVERRAAGNNIWLSFFGADQRVALEATAFKYNILETEEADGKAEENPGLLLRLHPDVRSYVLHDLLA